MAVVLLAVMMSAAFATEVVPLGCTAPVAPSHVLRLLETAELRLEQLEDAEFVAAADAAAAAIGCLGEPLTREEAGRWHRVRGVRAYYGGTPATAAAHFRAYVACEPGAGLPSGYAAEGGKLLAFFRASLAEPDGEPRVLEAPAAGRVLVDGGEALAVPWGRAAVLQIVSDDGVHGTLDLDGQTPAPDLQAFLPAPAVLAAPTRQERRPVGLLAASVGSGVLAASSYAGSWYLRARFEDPDSGLSVEQLDQLRVQTNAATVASPVLAGVAVGLGVWTAVRW